MSAINPTTKSVKSLYRRSLKLALDWAVQRNLWRGQAVYIRSLFDANKNIRDPRQQRVLFTETEKLLQKWKHPDPYVPPTAPGGSKYERNVPAPDLPPPPRNKYEAYDGLEYMLWRSGSLYIARKKHCKL